MKMLTGLLYHDRNPHSGAMNMAGDAWLLNQAIEQQQISLRFYRWDEPTLSLGYFQNRRGYTPPGPLEELPRVGRLSGGGAILHDDELTYSFAIPATHPLAQDPTRLYAVLHEAFIAALARQGVIVNMRGTNQADRDGQFLCFLRGDRHDVLHGTHKILGSAQRRRKGAILQHGSLILGASALAPEIPGLRDLSGQAINEDLLIRDVLSQPIYLAEEWTPGQLPLEKLHIAPK